MSNVEEETLNAELQMEGGEAHLNSEEVEVEPMANLVGGKRKEDVPVVLLLKKGSKKIQKTK